MVEKLPKSMTDAKPWIQEAQITKQGKKKKNVHLHVTGNGKYRRQSENLEKEKPEKGKTVVL